MYRRKFPHPHCKNIFWDQVNNAEKTTKDLLDYCSFIAWKLDIKSSQNISLKQLSKWIQLKKDMQTSVLIFTPHFFSAQQI